MIEFEQFLSTSGLSTKAWGPSGWYFLFSCVIGGYPPQIVTSNPEHLEIQQHFRNLFLSLGYTMPCIFCRQSYQQFYQQLPIDNFLSGRIELMHWLYQMRDLVNQKLIIQEQKCYNTEKKRLKQLFHNAKISKREYYWRIERAKKETLYTKPSPPFEHVLTKYEQFRAVCSKRAKTCSLPKPK
uniref:thiol oxidase n=1 Tax=viral metagenome TaxID=1070528 RepID=A0A6C0H6S3_9ZZZZ